MPMICHYTSTYLQIRAGVPKPDYKMVWWIGWEIWWKIGQLVAQSDDRKRFWRIGWNQMENYMSDSIGWIAYNYLFLSLREMHYGINITKIVCDRSGSGNEKLDGIWANMNRIRLRPSTPNDITLFKIGQWDACSTLDVGSYENASLGKQY